MINRFVLFTFVVLPFVYLFTLYPDLPDRIPVHFDWRGAPDAWGPKIVLWAIPVIGVFIALLANLAVAKVAEVGGSLRKHQAVAYLTLGFTSIMLCYIIYGAEAGGYNGLGGVSILLGILFGGLGNYLPILNPNPYMGIRLPRTLNDESVWRKTHRFAGPVFLFGGLGLILNGIFLHGGVETVVMLAIVLVITVVPIVYAYRLPQGEDSDLV